MDIIKSIILGIVQGISEFLPISSSGHLVLASNLLNFENSIFFDVILHFGTLLSIVVVMRKEIFEMIKNPFSKEVIVLIVATIPAGLIGFFLSDVIEGVFSIEYVYFGFFFTGVILLVTKHVEKYSKQKEVGYKNALYMGVMQAAALMPGVSRSGSTIFGGVFSGLDREKAAKFSFLMSLPIIFFSTIFQIFKVENINSELILSSAVGGVFAFIFGIVGIKTLLKIIGNGKLQYFSYYLFALGGVIAISQII